MYSVTVGVYLLVQLISGNNVLKINWLQLSGKFLILFSVFGLLSSATSRKWPKIASSPSLTWRQPGRKFFPAPGADAVHRQTGPDQSVAKLAPVGADYFFSQPAQLEELLLSPSFFSLVCRVGHRRPWDGVLLASLAAVADEYGE